MAENDLETYINANTILMFVTNRASFGRDYNKLLGHDAGTFYPYTTISDIEQGNTPIVLYSGGLWLGGKVGGQTRVAVAEFSTEYWPGPMAAGTYIADAVTNPAYRVYKLYADSTGSNANTDYTEWPVAQGAPVDNLANPLILGDQTLWAVFNDANPATHVATAGSTEPLGIEVRQLTWASAGGDGVDRIVNYQYALYNRGSNAITDFYASVWIDPDIGGIEDELFGCDTLLDIFYAYNDGPDAVFGDDPPAVGVRFLYGLMVPSAGDSARFFDHYISNYRNLDMSAFRVYLNGADPQNGDESYNLMKGMTLAGTPLPSGLTFDYPGNPVAATGLLDTNPGNKHCLGSFGPITFNPGDSQYVCFRIGVGQGTNALSSLTNLKTILSLPNDLPTDIDENAGVDNIPECFNLAQNYPNPFNPSTTIEYSLPVASRVNITVYNVLGRRVKTLLDRPVSAGPHHVVWNGTDRSEHLVSSGIYFYRITAGDFVRTRKMILLK